LAARLIDPATVWLPLTVPFWYGETNRAIEIVSGTALWYSTGLPPVPVRWVLIRDPDDAFPPQALLCTDLDASPVQIVSWFVLRWRLETTFHEVRDHLGVETGRGWSEKNHPAHDARPPRLVLLRHPGCPRVLDARDAPR